MSCTNYRDLTNLLTYEISNSVLRRGFIFGFIGITDINLICNRVNMISNWSLFNMAAVYIEIWQQCTQMRTGFVILLSRVYFGDWVTEIRHFGPLKTKEIAHNSEHICIRFLIINRTTFLKSNFYLFPKFGKWRSVVYFAQGTACIFTQVFQSTGNPAWRCRLLFQYIKRSNCFKTLL